MIEKFSWKRPTATLATTLLTQLTLSTIALAQMPSEITELAPKIDRERTKCEASIRAFKEKVKPTSPRYDECRTKYTDAEAAFNSWIESIKLDMVARTYKGQEKYLGQLNEAIRKGVEVQKFTLNSGKNGIIPWPEMIEKSVSSTSDAMLKFCKYADSKTKDERDTEIKMLDSYKWPDFEKIKPE